eukprot:CAMPEP_0206020902 /NCGR_PEP_ID=MMETSP1464-20131121/31898_1 /ASSEMBLY_ACC=CAM_ASM_001124 /TAXON_ID=119497 /ORGANISM="Exanthemachrysis gayraliae, Strain RCC1523" /LENGTH=135 /DNA_ID=CAMNT_0053394841 /DNA_START=420 /DNA_END=830 /DNA_ORIENTATION=-
MAKLEAVVPTPLRRSHNAPLFSPAIHVLVDRGAAEVDVHAGPAGCVEPRRVSKEAALFRPANADDFHPAVSRLGRWAHVIPLDEEPPFHERVQRGVLPAPIKRECRAWWQARMSHDIGKPGAPAFVDPMVYPCEA